MTIVPRLATSLLAAILFCATAAAPAPAQPLFTGITGMDDSSAAAFDKASATGARFVNASVPWAFVAPREKPGEWQPRDPADPHYDWSSIDTWVLGAARAGLTPVLHISGAPPWANRCHPPAHLPERLCDPDPAALAEFAAAAARRYSGSFAGLPRVRYWQGLNEPNLDIFFNPQFEHGKPVSPRLYRTLLNSFYRAIKSVHRSNLVLAAGLGPIARPGATVGPMRFTRLLLCMAGRRNPHPTRGGCGGGVSFDIFDIHPYTTGGPTHEGGVDDVELGDLDELRELLDAAARAGRIHGAFRRPPLWITEFSWDSNPPDPGGLSPRIQTRWVAHALFQAWDAGVDHFFWYSLRDSPRNPDLPFSESFESGLYFRGSSVEKSRPKKAMYAFRFPFVAFPEGEGFAFWGRTPSSRPGSVTIQVRERGRWRTETTAHANRSGIFTGKVAEMHGPRGNGLVRAMYRGEAGIPFSLREVEDFYQPPFG